MRNKQTQEYKVAKRLVDLVSDLRLDLVDVALYIHDLSPRVSVNRILLMADIIKEEREEKENHNDHI